LHSCWSWFARPGSRDVLTQETECSPQLARLTAGHICMKGDSRSWVTLTSALTSAPEGSRVPMGARRVVPAAKASGRYRFGEGSSPEYPVTTGKRRYRGKSKFVDYPGGAGWELRAELVRGVAPSSRYRRGCRNQRGELSKVLGGG